MLKFNDHNIFVGYIKELLHTFNLPTIKCYKEDSFLYDGALFIKDNFIQQYRNTDDKHGFYQIMPYIYNQPILHYTRTLKENSNIYDSHTHQYLGEYLRFLRDYKKLDLMSMYNCFNNNVISSLFLTWKKDEEDIVFNTADNYKVYSVPVKLNKKYTIAFSTNSPIELVCGIYSKGIVEQEDDTTIYEKTYLKVPVSNFNKPFIYDNLTLLELVESKFLNEHEDDLKLFIKIPNNNTTSIVVLEGEYLHTNEKYLYQNEDTKDVWKHAKTIVNFEGNPDINNLHFSSSLQLLELNSNFSYPFADRLIEYLTDNSVTNIEIISDNIRRVQEALKNRKENSKYTPEQQEETGKIYGKSGITDYKKPGIWEDRYKGVLYNVAAEEGLLDSKFDVLGYLDKDVEIKLKSSEVDIYQKE